MAGSATFGTEEVSTEEYVLLAKTMTENGMTLEDAQEDIALIDTILEAKKVYTIASPAFKYTTRGHLRKNNSWYDMLDKIIESHIQNK